MQALSVAELYGVLDTDTRDWTDGLLSNIFREINKPLPAGKVRPLKACCCDATCIVFATSCAHFNGPVFHEAEELSCHCDLALFATSCCPCGQVPLVIPTWLTVALSPCTYGRTMS